MLNETECPKCKVAWKDAETIYEYFLKQGNSKEEASRIAKQYGCTKDNPKSFGINVIGVEIRGGYDGVSYWKCKNCTTYFDRWTMKEVDLPNE